MIIVIIASWMEIALGKAHPYATASQQEPWYRYMIILIGVWWTGLILIGVGLIALIVLSLLAKLKTKLTGSINTDSTTQITIPDTATTGVWTCTCGAINTGNICHHCGNPQIEEAKTNH